LIIRKVKIQKADDSLKIEGIIQGWGKARKQEEKRIRKLDNDIRKRFLQELSSDSEGSSDEDKDLKRLRKNLAVIKYLENIRELEDESSDADKECSK